MSISRPLFNAITTALQDHFIEAGERRRILELAFYDEPLLTACPPPDGGLNARAYTLELVRVLDQEQSETRSGQNSLIVLLNFMADDLSGDPSRKLGTLADRLRNHLRAVELARDAGLDPDRATLDELIGYYLNEIHFGFQQMALEYIDLTATHSLRKAAAPRNRYASWIDPLAGLDSALIELDGVHQPAEALQPTPVDNVREALLETQRGVLLGEPGSGKSWTLWRLALEHIAIWRGERDDPSTERAPLVPVPIRLQEFRGGTPERPQSFRAFVEEELGFLALHLDRLGREKRFIFLLDALNEMPRRGPRGADLVAQVRSFLRDEPHFFISCRVRDYRDDLGDLRPLAQMTLQPLTPPQIRQVLVQRLGEEQGTALWEEMGGSDLLLSFWQKVVNEQESDRFWRVGEGVPSYTSLDEDAAWRTMHSGARLIPLCRNPFMGFLVTHIFQVGRGTLPGSRAGLFGRFVAILLGREAALAEKRGEIWPDGRAEAIEVALVELARAMQAANGTVLARADAISAIAGREALLSDAVAANLLVDIGGEIRFAHQLLQEYFAARVLLEAMEGGESAERFFGEEWWDAGIWRETVVILGEFLGEGATGPNRVAQWLAPVSPEVALDVILRNGAGLTVEDVAGTTRKALIDSALARGDETHPYGRAAAYRVLALLNADGRPGVGLNEDGLPDILWVDIEGGEYEIGGDERAYSPLEAQKVTITPFKIARYPITNAQWAAFLDDEGGYEDDAWWDGLEKPERPAEPEWSYSNHPRETVTWHEAVAFCRWLTARKRGVGAIGVDEEIRLPREAEWEVAARGKEGRIYPWGGEAYESGRANVDEGSDGSYVLRQTSAVGIYSSGDTPEGISDLSGNVWEWTASKYEEGKAYITLRGGSWILVPQFARAASRLRVYPRNRDYLDGFRVILAPLSRADH